MKKVFLIVLLSTLNLGYAQFSDSLHKAFTGRKSFDFSFDSRNSFMDNNRLSVHSIKVGISFGKKIAIGGGFAWLNANTPVYSKHVFYDNELKRDTELNRQLSLRYLCYYFNYIYYQSKRWEFSIPMQIGFGKLGYTYEYKGLNKRDEEGYCFLYEPQVNVKFKVFRWFGVKGDIGYRFLFQNNNFIKNKFNSPLISFGVFIVWNEIALMTFPKNKWVTKKYGPSQW